MSPTVCGEVVGHVFAQAHSPDVLLKLVHDGIADSAAPSCAGRELLSAASSRSVPAPKLPVPPTATPGATGSYSSERLVTGSPLTSSPLQHLGTILHLGTGTLGETPFLCLGPVGLWPESPEPSQVPTALPPLSFLCREPPSTDPHTVEFDRDAPALLVIKDGVAAVVRLTHHHVHLAAVATAWERQTAAPVGPS